jgi:hypothetical protein
MSDFYPTPYIRLMKRRSLFVMQQWWTTPPWSHIPPAQSPVGEWRPVPIVDNDHESMTQDEFLKKMKGQHG